MKSWSFETSSDIQTIRQLDFQDLKKIRKKLQCQMTEKYKIAMHECRKTKNGGAAKVIKANGPCRKDKN